MRFNSKCIYRKFSEFKAALYEKFTCYQLMLYWSLLKIIRCINASIIVCIWTKLLHSFLSMLIQLLLFSVDYRHVAFAFRVRQVLLLLLLVSELSSHILYFNACNCPINTYFLFLLLGINTYKIVIKHKLLILYVNRQ